MSESKASRFFLCPLPPPGRSVSLEEGEAHHALHVLRLSGGDVVDVFDGQGNSASARLIEVSRKGVRVEVIETRPPSPRPLPRVHLCFAVPKGKRLDWLLEKATELGAASLQPIVFERSVAGGEELSPAALKRWSSHCIAAAKQCGLNYLPRIEQPCEFGAFVTRRRDGLWILGDAGPGSQPLAAVVSQRSAQDVRLVVGPEGGLSDAERAAAVAAGMIPARLGHTILRVETATVAMLATTVATCDRAVLPE